MFGRRSIEPQDFRIPTTKYSLSRDRPIFRELYGQAVVEGHVRRTIFVDFFEWS